MKLAEGSRYIFIVEKKIEFEGNEYWVLSGPDKKRYLLNSVDYSAYNITPGQNLDCRIDKINCKGEVFLEPEHPFYREGSVYEFRVESVETRVNKSGENQDVVILSGNYIPRVVVPAKNFDPLIPSVHTSVLLKVDRIVKGTIIIGGSDTDVASEKIKDSELHDFVILGESIGLDGKSCFVIKDKENNIQYTIPKEYYAHYGFKTGSLFKGRFLRYKEGHGLNIEPDSPFFKPGNIYDFRVREFIKLPDGIEDVMVVEDEYGYPHHVMPDYQAIPGSIIRFRVVKMRKGWPLLEAL